MTKIPRTTRSKRRKEPKPAPSGRRAFVAVPPDFFEMTPEEQAAAVEAMARDMQEQLGVVADDKPVLFELRPDMSDAALDATAEAINKDHDRLHPRPSSRSRRPRRGRPAAS